MLFTTTWSFIKHFFCNEWYYTYKEFFSCTKSVMFTLLTWIDIRYIRNAPSFVSACTHFRRALGKVKLFTFWDWYLIHLVQISFTLPRLSYDKDYVLGFRKNCNLHVYMCGHKCIILRALTIE